MSKDTEIRKRKVRSLIFILLIVAFILLVVALLLNEEAFLTSRKKPQQTTWLGQDQIVVCSQNLENYGALFNVKKRSKKMTQSGLELKERALINRFVAAHCDIIAVQEVLAPSKREGQRALERLAKLLSLETGRHFKALVGDSNDPNLRSGYLVASDSAQIIKTNSYYKTELPKLSAGQKQRRFSRGPFEVQLRVGRQQQKILVLENIHFKSRSSRWGSDPAGLEFETARMEMAEALRQIVKVKYGELVRSGEVILVLLGDRNGNYDTAAAKILEGKLTLKDFKRGGACVVTKKGMPLCKEKAKAERSLYSVLINDPKEAALSGTLRYRKKYYWLDDILLPKESLKYALEKKGKKGNFKSGLVYYPENASDHALIWVELNLERSEK
ncbi:MAG: endonuclease/exonuclease/phosphatase family protein [Bdellovibrionota bacterium]